jgi:hypothetical protein
VLVSCVAFISNYPVRAHLEMQSKLLVQLIALRDMVCHRFVMFRYEKREARRACWRYSQR